MTNLVFEPSKTTHWKNLFPKKMLLLGSQNLNEGEELIAQIKSVGIQEIVSTSGQKESVPVVIFENAPPMVLNITNSRTIACLYGENYDCWKGNSIQIYATQIRAFGQKQMALRIREAKPNINQNLEQHEIALKSCDNLVELQKVFMAIPKHLKPALSEIKDGMKNELSA